MAQVQNAKREGPATAQKSESTEIVKVSAKAMQVDIGPKVCGMLDRSMQVGDKAIELFAESKQKKYDALATMTLGILNAAKADESIDLSAAFSGDRKKMERLNNQLGIALGYKEITTGKDGDKAVQRVVVAKAVSRYFPGPNEDTNTVEYQRKNTFRSNFATTVKQCAQAAEGLKSAGIKAEASDGTLKISGPKVVEMFGQDGVLLNENASQKGKDNQLTSKPSFTAIRAIGGEEHDAVVHRGTNTRGTQIGAAAPKVVDPDTAIVSLCHTLIGAVGKYEGDLTAKVREALGQVLNTINVKLKG